MSASKSAISGKKDKNRYLVLLVNDGTEFHSSFLDCQTKQLTSKIKIYANSPKDFVENIHSNFGNKGIKAVFFNIFRIKVAGFVVNTVEYCKLIITKMQELNIPYYFISNKFYNITNIFIVSKVLAAEEGDEIITFLVGEADSSCIDVLSYTSRGYRLIKSFPVTFHMNEKPNCSKIIRDKIIENFHPKAIIAFNKGNCNEKIKFLQESVFTKSDNFILLNFKNGFKNLEQNFLIEKLKWLNDKSYTKYQLIPFANNQYVYFVKVGDKLCSRDMIDPEELLPFTKKEYILNLNLEYSVGYIDGHTDENVILQKFPYIKNSHKTEITVSVDEQHFPDIQIKPIIMDEICQFPKTLNLKTKIPVIAFYDFFSVICCFNDNINGYEFIDEWNGMYGRPLFISFDKEKPIYGEAAVEIYREKPSFVVSHIITILSHDPEKNTINDTWGFSVTKDSDNPLLLEFDTFEGTKKVATPSFLMALLLKEHIKVIKAEIGEKPKELAFFVFDDFDSDAKERLKKGLEESCKLLKIGFMMLDF